MSTNGNRARGMVLAVCTAAERGVPKIRRASVRVTKFGFEGDVHCGEMRSSKSDPSGWKPNERQLTIVAEEAALEAGKVLGRTFEPGELRENILVVGLGMLEGFHPGTLLRMGKVVLRVSEQNKPCSRLEEIFGPGTMKAFLKKRGLICTVVEGAGETIRTGNGIEVELPKTKKKKTQP